MRILLVLNKGMEHDYKVLVSLGRETLVREVKTLMDHGREKKAFDLVVSQADVIRYIPPGQKVRLKPDLTLVEDLL